MGKHIHHISEGLMDEVAEWNTVLLAIALDASEYISEWHMRSEKTEELASKKPKIFDLLQPGRSPATAPLQFLSSMLSGHPLFDIQCRLACTTTASELHQRRPDRMHKARRTYVLASTWTFIRHVHRYKQFKVLALGDPSLTKSGQLNVCEEAWDGHCRLCHLPGLGRVLYDNSIDARDMLKWRPTCFTLARLHSLSNNESEREHAENQKMFDFQANWDYYSARNLCRKDQRYIRDEKMLALKRRPEPQAAQPPAAHLPQRQAPLFNSIELWWNWYCKQRDKSIGISFNSGSREYWQRCAAEWESLSAGQRSNYTELWNQDTIEAKARKKAERSLQATPQHAYACDLCS